MSDALKIKLESVRALLGLKGANMSYAELFDAMSDLSLAALEAKKFGKKRAQSAQKDMPKEKALPATPTTIEAKRDRPTKVVRGNTRYIPQSIKHFVWQRDRGVCKSCGTRRHLNYDHIRPFALGGGTTPENLRLLCFQCNQRAGIRAFGVDKMRAAAVGRRNELGTTGR